MNGVDRKCSAAILAKERHESEISYTLWILGVFISQVSGLTTFTAKLTGPLTVKLEWAPPDTYTTGKGWVENTHRQSYLRQIHACFILVRWVTGLNDGSKLNDWSNSLMSLLFQKYNVQVWAAGARFRTVAGWIFPRRYSDSNESNPARQRASTHARAPQFYKYTGACKFAFESRHEVEVLHG